MTATADSMHDGRRAWAFARQLAFPRLAGRAGERQAAAILIKAFSSLGYDVVELPFPIVRTPWAWMRFALVCAFVLLIGAGLASRYVPLLAAGCCGVLLGGLPVMEFLWRRQALQNASEKTDVTSSNIIAYRPAPPTGPVTTLYLMAHYDSKSQTIALSLRILLIAVILLGALVFGVVNLLTGLETLPGTAWGIGLSYASIVLWIGAILSSLILLGVRTENRSPGALDNAGSVGVLLALAEAFRRAELRNVEPVFVSTGAEELGLLGACDLVRQWRSDLDPEKTRILNMDLAGVKGALRLVEGARMLQKPRGRFACLIARVADRHSIRLRSFRLLPGFLVDHIPFSRAGFQSATLLGVSGKTRFVHTEKDTMDLVDPEALDEAVRLVRGVVEEMETLNIDD